MKKLHILLTLIRLLTTQAYAELTKIRKIKAPKITLGQQLANYILFPDALRSSQKMGVAVILFRVKFQPE